MKARVSGKSIRDIEKTFLVSKSTLSGWFKGLEIAEEFKIKLENSRLSNLRTARRKAVAWHNLQKEGRLKVAQEQALDVISKIDFANNQILELALSMLYLGEGAKAAHTAIGSTNPLILKFFISALKRLYGFDTSKIKCELHLRADQDSQETKDYWSKTLGVPLVNFYSVSIDKRTLGRPTYPTYKGVCILQCGNVAIQRRLVYLSEIFCEKVTKLRAVSSVGRAFA